MRCQIVRYENANSPYAVQCDEPAEYAVDLRNPDAKPCTCFRCAAECEDSGRLVRALRDPDAAAYARAVRAKKREDGECINCSAVASFGSRCAKHRRVKPRFDGAAKPPSWRTMKLAGGT